jgi:hypothetical protein
MGRWYSLSAAQKKVGYPGTRGQRLLTYLRSVEREEGVSIVKVSKTPTGKTRRRVNELTLLRYFPKAFKEDLDEAGLRPARQSERRQRRSAASTSGAEARNPDEAARTVDAARTKT